MAQTDLSSFSISRLTPDDGLSQGSNYFRYEDSRGFMWITGNDAVNRYDGSMVKVYNLNKYFKDCPNLQQGYGFAEDNEGNIYIGSIRGLYIYHRKTDKFSLQKIFTSNTDDIAMPFAFKDDKIYCFNKSYEITAYHTANKRVENIGKIPITPLNSIHIYDLQGYSFYYRWPFFDRSNNIWVVGKGEVVKMNNETKETIPIRTLNSNNQEFYCSFYDSSANELLLGTSRGLIIHNIITGQQKHIETIAGLNLAGVIAVTSNKKMTVLRCTNGIVFISKASGTSYWVENTLSESTHLIAFGFDNAERLWICNDGLGQVIYDFSPKLLPKLPQINSSSSIQKQFGVICFAEFSNRDIILPNSYILNHQTKALENIKFFQDTWTDFGFRAETDKIRKGVWLSDLTYKNKKLNIYFAEDDKKPILKATIDESTNLGGMQQIKVINDGRVLALFSHGLYWLKDRSIEKIKNQPGNGPFVINPLSDNRYSISYLNNDMWLIRFIGSEEIKFEQKILPGVQAFYIQEDSSRNRYWVGSNKGVYLLDKNFKQINLFDANNGLAGTYIYGLLLDHEGNAWCSHQRGLSSINATSFQIINYDKSDGIQDWDYNNRAFYKSSDGTLYFGGVNGFNYFKPPLKQISFYKPEVYIDEIWVNHKTYLPDTNVNFLQKLNLSFAENNISIKAIVKDLANGKSRQLIYRIKETDIKWKNLTNNNIISFNTLSPGTYTLELGIYDKYSNKEITQKTLRITIAEPFYKLPWFWAVLGILVTASLFGLYNRIKNNKQRLISQQQLALQQQRNKITADLHDDIGASLSSLQVNSAVASQLLGKDMAKTREVLNKVEIQSQNIADKIGDIIWSMKPGKDEFMTLSTRIKNFANEMLGSTNINYQIQIDTEVDNKIKDISTRKNIVLIAKESVNNAVKYSEAKNLTISLQLNDGNIQLSVTDDGIGFNNTTVNGNGLANMRKRVEELNGVFSIVSNAATGTCIKAVIPLVP